jgi:hypothetical protein
VSRSDLTLALASGAAVAAVISLGLAVWYLLWMRRVRRAQQALLAGRNVDLVEFAVGMQSRQEHVEALVAGMVDAIDEHGARIDQKLGRRAIVRYDGIRDIGGHQSTTMALLDTSGSGVVVSAVQGRDLARIYIKDVVNGEPGSIELTPEEHQAVVRAMG